MLTEPQVELIDKGCRLERIKRALDALMEEYCHSGSSAGHWLFEGVRKLRNEEFDK